MLRPLRCLCARASASSRLALAPAVALLVVVGAASAVSGISRHGTTVARSASTRPPTSLIAEHDAPSSTTTTTAAPAPTPVPAPGYQLATDTGDVLAFGVDASAPAPSGGLPSPVQAVSRTPSGNGAWLLTADGGVRTTGDAAFFGSLAGLPLRSKVVDIAATPTGHGYWIAAADGGVFTFGDAPFFGGTSGLALHAPISALVPTPDGRGYWLAGGDGGVYTFGDAAFYGHPDASALHSPVVDIAPSSSGHGYWLASADGGVYTYGDAPFLGAAGLPWGRVVGMAAGTGTRRSPPAVPAAGQPLQNRRGNDVSWPQCDTGLPDPGYAFGVVGITGGKPFTANPCLARQWRWATANGSGGGVYVNLASAVPGGPAEMHGPAGDCAVVDLPCQTYNQAANTIGAALAEARAHGVDAPVWWLDVEVMNHWSTDDALNTLTVRAAAETLGKAGIRAGVYSTPVMWRIITGGARLGLPVWVAGGTDDAGAPALCGDRAANFTGGGVLLVQSIPLVYDVNYACEPVVQAPSRVFHFSV